MARKRMTVTTRFFEEKRAIASRRFPSPFPNPPPNRSPLGRLHFHGPTPKFDCSAADLARLKGEFSLPDAILFLDTNVFTRELDMSVWEAFFKRRILVTPGIWKELLPWLKNPFHNKTIRDRFRAAVQIQIKAAKTSKEGGCPQAPSPDAVPNLSVLFADD